MIIMNTKRCTKCGEEKDFYSFGPMRRGAYGLRGDCKECNAKKSVGYYKENKERCHAKRKKYYEAHKKEVIARHIVYQKERRANDPKFAFMQSIRGRLNRALGSGSGSGVRDLGCSVEWAMEYLESQFEDGMTWENRGEVWHVDHMFPISAVDPDDRAQVMAVCNWRNLQPLSIEKNTEKGNKIYPEHRRLFDGLVSEMRTREEERSGMDASGSHC